MNLVLKTEPATEPVTLPDVKGYMRITDTDDDALITGLITATRMKCEAFTRRALITQTWALWLDRFPKFEEKNAPRDGYYELPITYFDSVARVLQLPRPPLQSVTFLKTYDAANVATVFDAANTLVDVASNPGRIALNQNQTWPTGLRAVNAVEIEFVAGYGVASQVPEPIKQGILLWIKLMFANKSKLYESDESTPGLLEMNRDAIPVPVAALWQPYKVLTL
jgi:uncharacterized phiE125 gp8 family phage protein